MKKALIFLLAAATLLLCSCSKMESSIKSEISSAINSPVNSTFTPEDISRVWSELYGDTKVELYRSALARLGENGNAVSDSDIITNANNAESNLNELFPGMKMACRYYVKNIGSTDAYVRITVKIIADFVDNGLGSFDISEGTVKAEFDWVKTTETVDGVKYYVYKFTRKTALKPGEMTYNNVWGYYCMSADVTYEDVGPYNQLYGGTICFSSVQSIEASLYESPATAFNAYDNN